MLTSANLVESWYYKVHFLKLDTKFEVSGIILTNFRKEQVILSLNRKMNT